MLPWEILEAETGREDAAFEITEFQIKNVKLLSNEPFRRNGEVKAHAEDRKGRGDVFLKCCLAHAVHGSGRAKFDGHDIQPATYIDIKPVIQKKGILVFEFDDVKIEFTFQPARARRGNTLM